MDTVLSKQDIWNILESIPDPEIPVVNIVEMGIVRGVEWFDSQIQVTMTPTFSACPALNVIRDSIKTTLQQNGFNNVEVKTILSPLWTTDWLTSEAKEKLKAYGITPPNPNESELIQLDMSPKVCPYCDSFNTTTKNTFGSTLCKSIHYCNSCQQPFEAFKAV